MTNRNVPEIVASKDNHAFLQSRQAIAKEEADISMPGELAPVLGEAELFSRFFQLPSVLKHPCAKGVRVAFMRRAGRASELRSEESWKNLEKSRACHCSFIVELFASNELPEVIDLRI